MNFKLEKHSVDWVSIERRLGLKINSNYRDYYEVYGSIELDETVIIAGLYGDLNLKLHKERVMEAYEELNEFISEEIEISDSNWLPVGYTIDATFIFCNENSVLLTNGGFEDLEVYRVSLLDFINMYLNDEINSENLPDSLGTNIHKLKIISK